MAAAAAASSCFVKEVLPPPLNSSSEPPALFDGATRLYISYFSPFAQRTWIVRNIKGLQEKIKLVPIDLQNRPDWYKEKVYPGNKVKGESLDLIKFIDEAFEGPKLLPDDPAKRQFAEELFSYCDSFNMLNFKSLPSPGDVGDEVVAAYDKIEEALSKFDDGPFFLGQFSLVNKEKVYPRNKVPSLEHNNEVKGESLDLIKFIDETFEGPKLLPDDPTKRQFAEELFSYSDNFNILNIKSLPSPGDVGDEVVAANDKIEEALSKFNDGPFFLGQFSLVDIAYAPFIERFQYYLAELKNYDVTKGRPNLTLWIEEMNKIDAYTCTRQDLKELLARTKKRLGLA